MKIALFYPKNLYASWYALGGYATTLAKMGHEVLDCPFPGNQVVCNDLLRKEYPPLDVLLDQDCILSAFHEYSQPWLGAIYGRETWSAVMDRVPVVARYDESMDRRDLALPDRVPELLQWAHHHSFPAAQDAEKFGGQWLPFGADASIFTRLPSEGDVEIGEHGEVKKDFDVGFIGSMYKGRQEQLSLLMPLLQEAGIHFRAGAVVVQDVDQIHGLDSTLRLARNYRRFKIFFCLQPMSRLLVCKAFEVMACGTFLMYPRLPWSMRQNLEIFRDGKEIVYYDPGYRGENVRQIKSWLEKDAEREEIARNGAFAVRSRHSLDRMLSELLAPVAKEKNVIEIA